MDKLSFDETMKKLDLIVSDMKCADAKNDAMFRRVCREIFQNSYSKLTAQNNLNTVAKMAISGAISAYKKSRGKYKKGSYAKSFKKICGQTDALNYSDLEKINQFMKKSEFTLVVKLLKIQYNFGLKEVISSVDFH